MKREILTEPDNKWLHLDYYKKLSTRENPRGYTCILCDKTHKTKECPHKNTRTADKTKSTQYSYSAAEDEGTYGW